MAVKDGGGRGGVVAAAVAAATVSMYLPTRGKGRQMIGLFPPRASLDLVCC